MCAELKTNTYVDDKDKPDNTMQKDKYEGYYE